MQQKAAALLEKRHIRSKEKREDHPLSPEIGEDLTGQHVYPLSSFYVRTFLKDFLLKFLV